MTNAQEQNFTVEDGTLIWQKVFTTELSFKELSKLVKTSGIYSDVEIIDNSIIGKVEDLEPDFKGAGYSEMSTPMYISRNFLDCHGLIEFKDGRYRVTLKKIYLTQKYDDGVSEEGERTSLETYAVKRRGDKMKGLFLQKPSEIFNYTFEKKFNFQVKKDETW
jgi:hypothetical protein